MNNEVEPLVGEIQALRAENAELRAWRTRCTCAAAQPLTPASDPNEDQLDFIREQTACRTGGCD